MKEKTFSTPNLLSVEQFKIPNINGSVYYVKPIERVLNVNVDCPIPGHPTNTRSLSHFSAFKKICHGNFIFFIFYKIVGILNSHYYQLYN